MVPRRAAWLAAVVLGAACARQVQTSYIMPLQAEEAPDERLLNLLAAALAADARLEPAAPLYAEEAILVADGERRHFPPRFAGIGPGGMVGITSSRVEVRQGVAWALVEYRWISPGEGTVREGRATVVMQPLEGGGGGWRIVHAHSSSPPAA